MQRVEKRRKLAKNISDYNSTPKRLKA